MSTAIGTRLLGSLQSALGRYRACLEERPGQDVAALGPATGTIADMARDVLAVHADALGSLARFLTRLDGAMRAVDAARALVEVGADAGEELLRSISLGELSARLGLPHEPIDKILGAATAGARGLAEVQRTLKHLPQPDDLVPVRTELARLLGREVDPREEGAGILGDRLSALGAAPREP